VIYDIRHQTIYEYTLPVAYSHCSLRLLPVDEPGQKLLDSSLVITPPPAEMVERSSFFGNRVTWITVNVPHRVLKLDARSSLDVNRAPPPDAKATANWQDVREAAYRAEDLTPTSPAHFLFPSRFVPRFPPAMAYAKQSFPSGRPVLEGAAELMRRMRADFRYDPKATLVSTPLSVAFANRRGVCQDFAHIMIAGLRDIGLPAAYVSGYLRTIPPPGKPRLEGADASHAWVSLWCGLEHGWIGLDPTNAALIGNDHVVLARGRDYSDISPVSGIVLGSGEQDVEVKVDVVPRAA
jgi:transglutaminase-like putative cysteine protease